jgi:uncharacterized membrane protein YdbT with pleckstrin-like domain
VFTAMMDAPDCGIPHRDLLVPADRSDVRASAASVRFAAAVHHTILLMNQEDPKETLVWTGTPSQWTNVGLYFFCVLIVAAIVVAYFLSRVGAIVFVALVIPLLLALARWAQTRSHVYEVTTERIRISTGVLSRQTSELELYRVRDYTIVEPLLLRLVGRGDVILETADRTNHRIVLHAVPNVAALKDQIRDRTERMRQRRGVRDFEINPQ